MSESETLTIRRQVPSGHIATAELEIREPGGQLSPGFSITGELAGTAGAIGDELARLVPELEPFARLHLSNLDGVPMHAEANARYYHEQARGLRPVEQTYGRERDGESREEYCRRIACEILRVDALPAELDTASDDPASGEPSAYRAAFADFVEQQRARWLREADEGRALFARLREHPPEPPASEDPAKTGSERTLTELLAEYGGPELPERFDSREMADAAADARVQLEDDQTTGTRADLRRLVALVDELAEEVGAEWPNGVAFIPDIGDRWTDYARELAADIGAMPGSDAGCPAMHIDWDAAAETLRQDYSETIIDGTTYLYR